MGLIGAASLTVVDPVAICPSPKPAPAIGAPLAAAAWATVAFSVGPIAVMTAAPATPISAPTSPPSRHLCDRFADVLADEPIAFRVPSSRVRFC